MRRQFKKPRVKKVKVPKPIAPPKPVRPKRGDLNHIYKELLTTEIDQRVNALAKAMAWYDKVQAYLAYKNEGKWTTKQLRAARDAESHRLEGISAKTSDTKEYKFQHTIQYYEIMVSSYQPPKLAPYLRKLKSSKSTLHVHKHNMQKKHKKFLQLIYDALRVKIGVDKLSSPYKIKQHNISDCHVVFDRKVVMNLRRLTRKHGLLSAVIQLLPVLSEAMSQYPEVDNQGNKTGRYKVDYGDRYKAVLQLISNLNSYGQREDAIRSLVRRHKPMHQTTTT